MTTLDPAMRSGTSPTSTAADRPQPAGPTASPDGEADLTNTQPAPRGGGRKAGRMVVVLALVSIVVMIVLDILLGRLAFTTRQDHLAADYNDPTIAQPERGGPLMVLQVEPIEVNLVVAEGSDGDILRGGPGLMEGSSLPGEGGTTVVMGRSSRFSGYFGFIRDLPDGTEILVRLRAGLVARYEVVDTRTVGGDEFDSIDLTAEDQLVLVTSKGGPLDSRRVIVEADLTGISEEAGAAAADDTSAPAAEDAEEPAAADTSAPAAEDAEEPAAADTSAPAAEDAEEPAAAATGEPAAEDAVVEEPGDPPGTFDVRPPAAMVMFLAGLLVIALGIAAVPGLRRHHPTSTTTAVAGPAIALGVVLVLFHLDAILPVTF